MKRFGIGTLTLFGVFLICEKGALANLMDGSGTAESTTSRVDDGARIEQFFQGIGAERQAIAAEPNEQEIDGYFFNGAGSDFQDASRIFTALNDGSVFNRIMMLAISHRTHTERSLDDATGQHGLLDTGGTVVTLHDPKGGGGTVFIGINSSGQIIGNVYGRIAGRGFQDMPRLAEVREPRALPFLAGCLPILAIALFRKRNRSRLRRTRYSSSRLVDK